jgi:hypothetical protein
MREGWGLSTFAGALDRGVRRAAEGGVMAAAVLFIYPRA